MERGQLGKQKVVRVSEKRTDNRFLFSDFVLRNWINDGESMSDQGWTWDLSDRLPCQAGPECIYFKRAGKPSWAHGVWRKGGLSFSTCTRVCAEKLLERSGERTHQEGS